MPLYTVLGMSVCFALNFSAPALSTVRRRLFDLKSGEGLENEKQLLIMLVFSTFMGGAFGLISGLLDVEDATAGGLRIA